MTTSHFFFNTKSKFARRRLSHSNRNKDIHHPHHHRNIRHLINIHEARRIHHHLHRRRHLLLAHLLSTRGTSVPFTYLCTEKFSDGLQMNAQLTLQWCGI